MLFDAFSSDHTHLSLLLKRPKTFQRYCSSVRAVEPTRHAVVSIVRGTRLIERLPQGLRPSWWRSELELLPQLFVQRGRNRHGPPGLQRPQVVHVVLDGLVHKTVLRLENEQRDAIDHGMRFAATAAPWARETKRKYKLAPSRRLCDTPTYRRLDDTRSLLTQLQNGLLNINENVFA